MSQNSKAKGRILRACRSLHSWLSVIVLPWVIVIGLTGFYLNHAKLVGALFVGNHFSESGFEEQVPATPITRESARRLGKTIWPQQEIRDITEQRYHGRPSYVVKKRRGTVILSIPTGHHYLKTRYLRRTFSPRGELLHTKVYWGRIFKELHVTGWLGRGLGTWLADAVSISMVVFGLTGAFMWWTQSGRRLLRAYRRAS
jgi:hypothetical protein